MPNLTHYRAWLINQAALLLHSLACDPLCERAETLAAWGMLEVVLSEVRRCHD